MTHHFTPQRILYRDTEGSVNQNFHPWFQILGLVTYRHASLVQLSHIHIAGEPTLIQYI